MKGQSKTLSDKDSEFSSKPPPPNPYIHQKAGRADGSYEIQSTTPLFDPPKAPPTLGERVFIPVLPMATNPYVESAAEKLGGMKVSRPILPPDPVETISQKLSGVGLAPIGGQSPLEGVRQKLESVKISPAPHENPYVELLSLRLQECYRRDHTHPPHPLPVPHPPRQSCCHSNQYIDHLNSKLGGGSVLATPPEPHPFVEQLHYK